jgi:hypothetical protein
MRIARRPSRPAKTGQPTRPELALVRAQERESLCDTGRIRRGLRKPSETISKTSSRKTNIETNESN